MKSKSKLGGVKPQKKYDCKNCSYHKQAYSRALGTYVHSCTYISKVTAWACKMEEENI